MRWVSTTEEIDAGLADGLLDADAVEGGSDGRAVLLGDGIIPEAGGAIAALGRPDAARVFADVALMSGDGGADLGANALVCAEQWHVAVGGAAGDDLDEAGVVEVAKAFDDVAVEGIEVVEGVGEVFLPEAGELGVVEFADGEEVGFVFAGGEDFALEVAGEVGLEDGVGELLEEDGREIEAAVEGDAVALEIAEDAEERKVGFGRGFVEPLDAVGPGAVVHDPREMGVESEGEKASGLAVGMGAVDLGCLRAQCRGPFWEGGGLAGKPRERWGSGGRSGRSPSLVVRRLRNRGSCKSEWCTR